MISGSLALWLSGSETRAAHSDTETHSIQSLSLSSLALQDDDDDDGEARAPETRRVSNDGFFPFFPTVLPVLRFPKVRVYPRG
uniref:Putative secreted protein n=1 Tax=Anopheles marajoara TaxID=58244 RepID=A0A2M4CBB4_9DIPT